MIFRNAFCVFVFYSFVFICRFFLLVFFVVVANLFLAFTIRRVHSNPTFDKQQQEDKKNYERQMKIETETVPFQTDRGKTLTQFLLQSFLPYDS